MSSFKRLSARELLAVDGVLTADQLQRWVGDRSDLPPLRILRWHRRPLPVYVDPSLSEVPEELLPHLAALGELRRVLGARPEEWFRSAKAGEIDYRGLEPDAVWARREGKVLIEVDLGDYSRPRVLKKLNGYRGPQVWGVLSVERKRFIENVAPATTPLEVRVIQL